jgi:hypothetical protein
MKAGDRYRYKNSLGTTFVWEVNADGVATVIDAGSSEWEVGTCHPKWRVGVCEIYLGNFSKSSNFRDIYDILNG